MNGVGIINFQFCTALASMDTILQSQNKYAAMVKILLAVAKIHKNSIVRLGADNS